MAGAPQHLHQFHNQFHKYSYGSVDISPSASPTHVRKFQKPLSPVSSTYGDADHEALERLAAGDTAGISPDLQHYPIRSRRTGGDDHLASGLSVIGNGLSETLLPLLQIPMPKGPDNVGAPNCRGVKGAGGSMVSVAPMENVYAAIRNTAESQNQQMRRQGRKGQQASPKMEGQEASPSPEQGQSLPLSSSSLSSSYQSQHVYATPAFTPSPPSMKESFDLAMPPTSSAPSATPTSQPATTAAPAKPQKSAAKQPKKEKEEFKTEFRFVVNEDAKTARNTVRQHVMREFRRRERWEQGKNKVSKAKKPKKEAKEAKQSREKSEDDNSQAIASSFDGSMQDDSSDGYPRRDSHTMSISGSSDGSGTEGDSFSALLHARTLSHKRVHPSIKPFAKYADRDIGLRPQDVEDAVEEIERSELAFVPYKNDPWAEIARAEINPFASSVTVGAGPASRALLHHYAWVMPSLMDEIVTGNVFHRIGWLYSSVAVHDPTPYHTIMGFTLGHVAMLRGMDEPPMAIEHKDKSLQLINRRLANPMVAASDGSIGAICNIAAYELIDCRPERFSVHMQGLARLVTQRGGMSDFIFNPELETVLIRLDVIRAYVTISSPRFPAWGAVRKLTPLAINIGPPSTEWFCAPAQEHQHAFLYSEDAIRMIHNVEDILLLMRSLNPTIPFTPDPTVRTLLVESVISHLRRDMLDAPVSFQTHLSRRVLRMAALVMLDIAAAEFFNLPADTAPLPAGGSPHQPMATLQGAVSGQISPLPINSSQEGPERAAGSPQKPVDKKGLGQARLRKRFPQIEHNRHEWGRSVEMIAAVLMQAERMALERPFRAWYVADVVTMTMKLGDSEWAAIEVVLKADLFRRVMEERKAKEERKKRGVEEESAWDLEEVLSQFWSEWAGMSGNGQQSPV